MNIFKKIKLIGKIQKAVKKAKTMIDANQGLAFDVRNRLKYLVADIEEMTSLLPQFKPIYKEIVDIIKEVF
jgi:hypothetical protein